ncbi:MAG: FHA domain-containing protein [Saccharospirillaceae bacterium]|nr:FHA domain-containing protein [Pseudomonadales bacterium]NRB80822.1 FHA domain-containing protein [Saccharospirillaceae bacterium]
MAYLRNLKTNEQLYLLNHHIFGRHSGAVDTVISQPEISKIHASIKWSGKHWLICDLSRNGTWLDNKKLPKGDDITLKSGQQITFLNQSTSASIWKVENLDSPCNLLIGVNDLSPTAILNNYHLIPNDNEPLAAIFLCNTREKWVLEKRNNALLIDNEEYETVINTNGTIEIDQYKWLLFINNEQQQTVDLINNKINNKQCEFLFEVSLDEEHTQLSLLYQNNKVDLGERSHHYFLLHLARIKSEHAKQGLDLNSQGWINNEQLAKELGIDTANVSLLVFRARKQMAQAFPNMLGMSDLLQRRRGEVRFNCPQALVIKGSTTEVLSA